MEEDSQEVMKDKGEDSNPHEDLCQPTERSIKEALCQRVHPQSDPKVKTKLTNVKSMRLPQGCEDFEAMV